MSDREPRDPLDDAYVGAERLLNDDTARAARRARVLAAVTAPAAAASPASAARRAPRWRSGWAAAAAVGGLGVLVATFVSRSVPPERLPAIVPADDAAHTPGPPQGVPAAEPPVFRPAAPPVPAAPARRAAPPSSPARAAAPPPAMDISPPPPPPPPLPLPPTPAPVRQSETPPPPPIGELRDKEAPAAAAVSQRSVERPEVAIADADAAATLRRAAAAGRTAQVEAALNRGALVDAPDANGDTALMLSVRGGHFATAALLRRRGADPERLNRMGDSAGALATASGDPRLEDAVRAPVIKPR